MASYNLRTVLKMMGQNILNWVKSNCVNNLLSTATNLPLAAAQGKVLDEKIGQINQSLGNKVNTNDSRLSDTRTPKAHTHDDRYYTETETDNLLASVTRYHLGVLVKAETITVPAKSSRDYAFPFTLSSATKIIAQVPILTGYALGISIGRDAAKDFVVRLWNNNSSSQNVNVQYYVVYVI